MDNIVFFDLETKYLANEVGGWSNIPKMGLAVAVTYATADSAYHDFVENQAAELVDQLQQADLVVGFNVRRFDYQVLQPYTDVRLQRLTTVDMLQDLHRVLGFRVSLDAVAEATLGSSKSADGIQAVHWFRRGEIDKVIAYCRQDVQVTRDIYEFAENHGYVRYRDRYRGVRQVRISWKT